MANICLFNGYPYVIRLINNHRIYARIYYKRFIAF
jgi:hypothetical protein